MNNAWGEGGGAMNEGLEPYIMHLNCKFNFRVNYFAVLHI